MLVSGDLRLIAMRDTCRIVKIAVDFSRPIMEKVYREMTYQIFYIRMYDI